MQSDKVADKISITICGDGGCGKSSITLRLVRSQWVEDYDPTIEDSYSVTRTVDGVSYHLALTDTAGQEEYRGLWASSNLVSDAFLLVYDITNPQSLNGLAWFLDMIEMEADNRIEQNNRLIERRGTKVKGRVDQGWNVPPVTIIVGNKCDLNEARAVVSKKGWDYARRRSCGFMETSAREMINIEETFAWIVRKVVAARRGEPETARKSNRPTSDAFESFNRPDPKRPSGKSTPSPLDKITKKRDAPSKRNSSSKTYNNQSSSNNRDSSVQPDTTEGTLNEKSTDEEMKLPWYKAILLKIPCLSK